MYIKAADFLLKKFNSKSLIRVRVNKPNTLEKKKYNSRFSRHIL